MSEDEMLGYIGSWIQSVEDIADKNTKLLLEIKEMLEQIKDSK